jgi:PAS domain-containing protein
MDGFETATLIRSGARNGRTPILFVTAHEGDRAWVERAYALGAVDYLVKPLVPVIVRAKVAGFVELFEKTQEVIRQAEELRRWDRRGFEERLAEEGDRLRQSEEKFRTLADSIPQLAWMTRPDGHIEWYNRRWYEYTGTTPEADGGLGLEGGPRPRRVAQGDGQLDGRHRPWRVLGGHLPAAAARRADALAPVPSRAAAGRRRPGGGLARDQHRHRGSPA